MLNRIALMGRLTREPELRYTQQNKPVCTITLAVERDYARPGEQREADFVDMVCWNRLAEFAAKYFRKGQLVACEGRLQSRKWKDKFEQARVTFEVIADNVYFAERAERPAASAEGQVLDRVTARSTGGWPPYHEPELPQSDFAALEDDDDVPF